MKSRNPRGSQSLLVCSGVSVLVTVGIAFVGFNLLLGGNREVQNATDAGALNVAKTAIANISVPLQGQTEKDNFGYLADANGNINLLAYNRIAAQATMVGLNCQAEDNNSNAVTNANAVIQAASDIGKRLAAQLALSGNKSPLNTSFQAVAGKESVHMVQKTAKLNGQIKQVAYLQPGTASSVYIPTGIYPHDKDGNVVSLPANFLSTCNGQSFLNGYQNLSFSSLQSGVSCVPVRPGCQPNLISLTQFCAPANGQPATQTAPPNAFEAQASACNVCATAGAEVGALDQTAGANFSKGFITICNSPGQPFNGYIASPTDIFNFELMTGIFCGPANANNQCAYTTDPNQYQQWLNYNTGKCATKPSTANMYGDCSTITQPAFLATWQDLDSPIVQNMLPQWKVTYNRPDSNISQTCPNMTAVEMTKALIMQGRGHLASNGTCTVNAPQGCTGMKKFDHNKPYPAYSPGAYPINFAQQGTAYDYLTQCNDSQGGGAANILNQLTWKAQQIVPGTSQGQVVSLLQSCSLNLGQTSYIYANSNNQLICSNQAPTWVSSAALTAPADGCPVKSSCTYDVIFQSCCTAATKDGQEFDYGGTYGWINTNVPNQGDCGYHFAMFTQCPPLCGIDTTTFTPSSGCGNNLGTLCFTNQTVGGGTFSAPN